jgi:hypothetical protein
VAEVQLQPEASAGQLLTIETDKKEATRMAICAASSARRSLYQAPANLGIAAKGGVDTDSRGSR